MLRKIITVIKPRYQSETKKSPRTIWIWLALGAVVLTLTLLIYFQAFNHLVDGATDWAKDLMNDHPVMGAVVFFLFSAISAMLAFASSAVLVPPANLVWGKLITFVLLWAGWIAGAIVAFGLGNLAHPLLIRLGYGDTLRKYRQFVSKRMKFWAVLLFCIAVPSEVPGYLLGGAHYPFLKFLAAIGIAESIYAFGLVVAGESFVRGRPLTLFISIAILIVIAAGASLWLRFLKRPS